MLPPPCPLVHGCQESGNPRKPGKVRGKKWLVKTRKFTDGLMHMAIFILIQRYYEMLQKIQLGQAGYVRELITLRFWQPLDSCFHSVPELC